MTGEKFPSDQQVIESLKATYGEAYSGSMPLDRTIETVLLNTEQLTSSDDILTDAKKSAVAGQIIARLALLVEDPTQQSSLMERSAKQLDSAARKLSFDARIGGLVTDHNGTYDAQKEWVSGAQKYLGSLVLSRQIEAMQNSVDGYMAYDELRRLVRPTDQKTLAKISEIQSGFMDSATSQPFVTLPDYPNYTHRPISIIGQRHSELAYKKFAEAWQAEAWDKDKISSTLNQSLSQILAVLDDDKQTAQLDIISRSELNLLLAETMHDLAELGKFEDNNLVKLGVIRHIRRSVDTLSSESKSFGQELNNFDDKTLVELIAIRQYAPKHQEFLDQVDKQKELFWYFRDLYSSELSGTIDNHDSETEIPNLVDIAKAYIDQIPKPEKEAGHEEYTVAA